jgi:hypothetical protein
MEINFKYVLISGETLFEAADAATKSNKISVYVLVNEKPTSK